ncbi:MAG: twin-arginine translocation signal domain-containing protein [Thermoleophilaceae bacterium]
MSEALNVAYAAIDDDNAGQSAHTRRRFVGGAAAAMGSMGLISLVNNDQAHAQMLQNDAQTILNVAATAEVLATIVNTVGPERLRPRTLRRRGRRVHDRRRLDRVTFRNVRAAAREELIHYDVLTGALGAKPLTKRIWIPDAVFRTPRGLLTTLEAGDQIFINAYLIGTTVFGNAGAGKEARFTGEFMGTEAVHRALARQSLGKLGNDRVFMKYAFTDIGDAVTMLQQAGFGFGEKGKGRGRFYDFDRIRRRTPSVGKTRVNTLTPR